MESEANGRPPTIQGKRWAPIHVPSLRTVAASSLPPAGQDGHFTQRWFIGHRSFQGEVGAGVDESSPCNKIRFTV